MTKKKQLIVSFQEFFLKTRKKKSSAGQPICDKLLSLVNEEEMLPESWFPDRDKNSSCDSWYNSSGIDPLHWLSLVKI